MLNGGDKVAEIFFNNLEKHIGIGADKTIHHGESVFPRQAALLFSKHLGVVGVRAVAQHRVGATLTTGVQHSQEGNFRHKTEGRAVQGLQVLEVSMGQLVAVIIGTGDVLLQLVQQFLFGLVGSKDDGGIALVLPVVRCHHKILDAGTGIPVPVVSQRHALVFRQEHQKVLLPFHAQEVHVQTAFQLMGGIAIDIKARHQQVVNTLQ